MLLILSQALAAEEEEEEMEDDYDPDMEEPAMKMTIENYPVGWDGKPIPYWLYKLHGLGVEYKCEVSILNRLLWDNWARFVVIPPIGVARRTKITSKNGVTHLV